MLSTIALAASPAALAAPDHPQWIGAPNLNQAPDVSFDCTVIPYSFGPDHGGWPSCAWGNPLLSSNPAVPAMEAPATGTVYEVKLRIGASTGPMKLVVLRTLFDPNDTVNNQCCVLRAISSAFTPVANGITTLNVTLPMGLGYDAASNVDYLDSLGLQILEDGVTIPVVDETSLPTGQRPVDTFNAPAMTLGESQKAGDPSGYMLDMQGLWYPPGQSPGVVTLPAHVVTIDGTTPKVALDCTLAPCTGTMAIQNTAPGHAGEDHRAADSAARRRVTYATGSFSLAAGARTSVPAALTQAGRLAARRHQRLKVYLVVTVTNVRPARSIVRSLTLRF